MQDGNYKARPRRENTGYSGAGESQEYEGGTGPKVKGNLFRMRRGSVLGRSLFRMCEMPRHLLWAVFILFVRRGGNASRVV